MNFKGCQLPNDWTKHPLKRHVMCRLSTAHIKDFFAHLICFSAFKNKLVDWGEHGRSGKPSQNIHKASPKSTIPIVIVLILFIELIFGPYRYLHHLPFPLSLLMQCPYKVHTLRDEGDTRKIYLQPLFPLQGGGVMLFIIIVLSLISQKIWIPFLSDSSLHMTKIQ